MHCTHPVPLACARPIYKLTYTITALYFTPPPVHLFLVVVKVYRCFNTQTAEAATLQCILKCARAVRSEVLDRTTTLASPAWMSKFGAANLLELPTYGWRPHDRDLVTITRTISTPAASMQSEAQTTITVQTKVRSVHLALVSTRSGIPVYA